MSTFSKHLVFKMAFRQAERLLSNRARLVLLFGQIASKLARAEARGNMTEDIKLKLLTLGRLLRAFFNGSYKAIGMRPVISIIAAAIYFVNPADIVPDIIPMSGLVDDFGILIWTYQSIQVEIDNFLEWEKSILAG